MNARIQAWREEHGVDAPEESARELAVDDVDSDDGALLPEWQTTRRTLALAHAALAIGAATHTGHRTGTDTDDDGNGDTDDDGNGETFVVR